MAVHFHRMVLNVLFFLFLIFNLAFECVADDDVDYYATLGLPEGEDSTEREIKKQFRLLSKKYHPDLNPSTEARDLYAKIQRAHEVLSDRKKRKVYDMKGEAGVKLFESQEKGQGQQQNSIFSMFGFGGGGGGGNAAQRGENVKMQVVVTLDDIYNGNTHRIKMKNKQKLCKKCKGSGAASKGDLVPCKQCKGKGVVVQRIQLGPGMVQQIQQECPHCQGKGKAIKNKCPVCNGRKVMKSDFDLEFEVEKGVPENSKLVFDMEADQSPDILPGDVILYVASDKHKVFKRFPNNIDLGMTMKLTLEESLLGFSKTFKHMDGRDVSVVRDEGKISYHGEKMTLKGEGMPVHNVPSETGNLIITFEVIFPRTLTDEQKEEVKKLL